jgi:cellulose synthase/poly-beta-1,6-N-acetylglucosamine synthase-like glycosyltransferase
VAIIVKFVTLGEFVNRWARRTLAAVGIIVFVALVIVSAWPFPGQKSVLPQIASPNAGQSPPSAAASPSTPQPPPPATAVPDGAIGAQMGWSGGFLPAADGAQAIAGIPPERDPIVLHDNAPRPNLWSNIGLIVAMTVVSIVLVTVAGTTLWWMLHAWRTPEALTATGFSRRSAGKHRSFSLLLPARHEQGVLGDTIDSLARLDHPAYEVIVIIGHDDPETEFVARAAAARHPHLVRVVIDDNVPKNKPKALNTALPECRNDIVGVFDAEDDVHPGLLRLVEARFEETGADVVQAGVQLMNVQTSWWSLRNCLEYYFWFRSRLHFHADQRFIPLGGNTVFTGTALLRELDGWDPNCLAEDCEIGVRLSSRGATVAVAYDPQAVTREETPDSIRALVKQRTRWDQGFLQVLRKGEWRRLPTWRQRWLARYTLAMPFLQATTGLLIPLSLAAMVFIKVPVPITLLTFLPLAPTAVTMAVESAALGEFGREFEVRIRARDHARLFLGTFPYQILLAFAALRSVWREVRGQGSWEKTAHGNVHRAAASPEAVAA